MGCIRLLNEINGAPVKTGVSSEENMGDSEQQRIQELEELVRYHADLYFNKSTYEITDAEFDALVDELRAIAPDSAALQEVGAVPSYGRKVTHERVMGSLDKVKTADEIHEWANGYTPDTSHTVEVAVMPKMDGCFTAESKVMLPNGEERNISDISEGDVVLSFNEAKGIFEPKKVTAILVRPARPQCVCIGTIEEIERHGDNKESFPSTSEPMPRWILLTMTNGKQIRCTSNHPFLTRGRGWVDAEDLTTDDDIMEVMQ